MPRRPGRVRLSWLGQPRIELGAEPVRLDTRKTTALLAYLSLADHPVSRERLAAMFWPEFDQVRAPANLRRSLAALRAALPGTWLAAERHRIGVDPSEGIWVDVWETRRLVAGVKAHTHEVEAACLACRTLLEQAAGLYGGDFLEGFTLPDCPEFDDWQLSERESIRVGQAWTLQHLALSQAETGQRDQALATARRWVALDKLHEPAQALLIRLLAHSGQRSAAARHYDGFADLLKKELGAQPDPKTREPLERAATGTEGAVAPLPAPTAPVVSPSRGAAAPVVSPSPAASKAVGPFEGLLRTKLAAPLLRATGVTRGRLVDAMNQGTERGIAVVSAPAGFGKSTLLCQWASRAGMPVAWLSLDASDNEPHRFLLYCAAALEAAQAGLGDEAADLLAAMPPAQAPVVMTSLINAIGSRGSAIALVLDDYQLIQAKEIHEAVRLLVDRGPPLLRLVIATREDPPLALARLRSQGALAEIGADELRFTTAEAEVFLRSSMSLSLSEENVELLARRTEGWIAGLQMAALSLQGRSDAQEFIAAFGGTHRHILDYLMEEVFSRQDEETRRFLLETSILGRMSAELCEAVTNRGGAQEMLERLDRANLFLIALDERRCWFRYHHLFADFLLHRLEHDRPAGDVQALRLRAGGWLGVNGELAEAIQQYLAAEGFDEAAGLIERNYVRLFSRGGLGELLLWCLQIPDDISGQRPVLGVVSAWALALAGKQQAAEAALESAERVLERLGSAAEGGALRGDIAIIRAFLNDLTGNTARAIELTRAAEQRIPADHVMSRGLVFYILGRAFVHQGDLESAERTFSDFRAFSVAIDNIWSLSIVVFWYLVLRRFQGSCDGCEQMIAEFEAQVDRHHARGNCSLAMAFAGVAEWKRERGLLPEASGLAEGAVRQAEEWGIPHDLCYCLYYLARAQRSMGRAREAEAALARAAAILNTSAVDAYVRVVVEAERAANWLVLGDIPSAVAWAKLRHGSGTAGPLSRHLELLAAARVRLATAASNDELDRVLRLLDDLTSSVRSHRWNGLLIDALLLAAMAKHRRFGQREALGAIDEAVRMAHAGGLFQTIVDEGPPMARLLREGLDAGMWADPALRSYVESVAARSFSLLS